MFAKIFQVHESESFGGECHNRPENLMYGQKDKEVKTDHRAYRKVKDQESDTMVKVFDGQALNR